MQGCSTATTLEAVVGEVGIFVSCSQVQDHHSGAHEEDKSNAIVGNIWHFDSKIGMDGLECFPGIKVENIKPQVDRRTEFGPQQPFRGLNINGSLHMAIPDRCAYRDDRIARCQGALVLLQHLQHS